MKAHTYSVFIFCALCWAAAAAQTLPQLELVSRTQLFSYRADESSALGIIRLMSAEDVQQSGSIIVLQNFGTFNQKNRKAAGSNFISGFDLAAKRRVWALYLPEPASSSLQAGGLVIATSERHVTAIDIQSGKPLWQFDGQTVRHADFEFASAEKSEDIGGNGAGLKKYILKTCADRARDEISILNYETASVTVLNSEGNLLRQFSPEQKIAALLSADSRHSLAFISADGGYYINSDDILYKASIDGRIAGEIAHKKRPCSVFPDSSGFYLCSKGRIEKYSAGLKLINEVQLKDRDQTAALHRSGGMLLAYTAAGISLIGPEGSSVWTYASDKGGFAFLGKKFPPLLMTPALWLSAFPDLLILRYDNRLEFVNRLNAAKVGEFVFGGEAAEGISAVMSTMMKSCFPLFMANGGKLYLIASGPVAPGRNPALADYLYEFTVK